MRIAVTFLFSKSARQRLLLFSKVGPDMRTSLEFAVRVQVWLFGIILFSALCADIALPKLALT